jgi:hypothetical protein
LGLYYTLRIALEENKIAGSILLAIVCPFLLFISYLFIFHTYLAASNTTTWECLSWSKISYLKDWPRKLGSPFNIGCRKNAKLVFFYDLMPGNYYVWKMPKRRPDIIIIS